MIYNYIPFLLAGLIFYVLLFKFTNNRLVFALFGALVAVIASFLLKNNYDLSQLIVFLMMGLITGFSYSTNIDN